MFATIDQRLQAHFVLKRLPRSLSRRVDLIGKSSLKMEKTMYAVVEAGGRQFELESGRYIDMDMVSAEPDQEFVFDKVLMIVDGEKSMVGKPYIDGAKVTGKVISHVRGPKLVVYKYRPKKGTRKRTGHRQGFTRVFINAIAVQDKVLAQSDDTYKKGMPEKK